MTQQFPPNLPASEIIFGYEQLGEFLGVSGGALRQRSYDGGLPIRVFGKVGSALLFSREDAKRYKRACEAGVKRLRKNRVGFGRETFAADPTVADAMELYNPNSGVVAGDLPTQEEQGVLDALDRIVWDLSDAWWDYQRPQERSIEAAESVLGLASQLEQYATRLRAVAEPVVIEAQREVESDGGESEPA